MCRRCHAASSYTGFKKSLLGMKGVCDVADYVQLSGDDGSCRGHGRLCGHAADLGADIASEQAVLSSAWQGDTGITYQGWQTQWNQA